MKLYLLPFVVTFSAAAATNELPVPPIPPADLPPMETAPVPNIEAQAPATPESVAPSINVKLYRAQSFDPSQGFTPGSRFQTNEDRKPIQTPGLSVSVPIP
jgi:hypothetical protein